MSTVVDNRVVQMEFDNSRFEKNIGQSISSLEKLKQALHLEGTTKAFKDVDKAANGVDFSGLISGCQTVGYKLSALETIGVGALLRIGQQAVDTGERLVKSLSVDQISAGFEKFGQKTQSVATLVSQGYDLYKVNSQLDRLNWYTDETSYNFTDMVDNIAKFTATGQNLEESVTAMEGIANWAALSGQNATTASRAMYQLSQSMGAGYLRYEDYKSVQNASMDTQEFRKALIDAALAAGTLRDNLDGTYSSLVNTDAEDFNINQLATSLTKGQWATSDVMMDVFNKYSAAVDQIYEYAEEKGITASQAIEDLGDQIDPFALKAFKAAQEARTFGDALDSVKDAASTGWMNVFENIFGNYEEAKTLWTDLANGLYDLFMGPMSNDEGTGISDIIAGWRNFDIGRSGKTVDGRDLLFSNEENNLGAIYILAQNLVDALNLVGEAWSSIFPPATSKTLYELTKSFREFTVNMQEFGTAVGPRFTSVFRGAFAVVDIFWQGIKAVGSGVLDIVQMFVPLGDSVLTSAANFGEWLVQLDESIKETGIFQTAVEKVTNTLESILEKVTPLIDSAKEGFSSFFDSVGDGLSEIDGAPAFETLSTIFSTIGKAAKTVGKTLKDIFDTLLEGVNLPSLDSILLTAGEAGIVGIVWAVKKAIDSFGESLENIGKFGGITDILDSVKDSLEAWQLTIKADAIRSLAVSVGILAGSLFVLSTIDAEDVIMPLAAVTAVLTELIVAFDKFNTYSSSTDSDKGGIFGAIANVTNSFKQLNQAKTLMTIATSVLVLAGALKLLSTIDAEGMLIGITGLSVIMAELTVVCLTLNKANISKTATGMVALSVAVLIMSQAIKSLSDLSWEQLAVGLAGLTVAMIEIAAACTMLDKVNVAKTATAMVAMGTAVLIMAGAIRVLGGMSWEELAVGLAGITAVIIELTAALTVLDGVKGALGSGAAFVLIATSILLLIPALTALAYMPLDKLFQGLLGIAGVLVTFIAAAALVQPVIPGLLALSAAFLALSTSTVIFGAGLAAIGAGIASLAAGLSLMSTLGDKVISGAQAVGTALTIIIGQLITVLPAVIFTAVTTLITTIITVVSTNIQQIVTVVTQLLSEIITAASTLLPQIITLLADTISQILSALTELVPQFCDFVMTVITSVLSAIEENTQQIVETVVQIIIDILNGITNKLPDLIQAGVDLIVALIQGITQAQVQLIDAGIKCIIEFINGLANSIRDNTDSMIDAVNNLMDAIIGAIAAWFDNFIENGAEIVTNIADGVSNAVDTLTDAFGDLLKDAIEWVKGKASDWIEAGSNLVEGLKQGIKNGASKFMGGITSFATTTLNTMKDGLKEKSPSKATEEMGENLVIGLENGIENEKGDVLDAAGELSEDIIEATEEPLTESQQTISEYLKTFKENLEVMTQTIPIKEAEKTYSSFDDVIADLTDTVEAFHNQYAEMHKTMAGSENAYEVAKIGIYNFGAQLAFADEQTVELGKTTEEVTKQIQERYAAVKTAIEEFQNGLKDTILSQFDMYSEFDYDTAAEDIISPDALLSNMQSWYDATEDWADKISDLADRGLSQKILQSLAEMGPEGYKKLMSFYNMTEEQLAKFNELYTNQEGLVDAVTDQITGSLANSGLMVDQGIIEGMKQGTAEVISQTEIVSQAIPDTVDKTLEIHSPSQVLAQRGQYIAEGLAQGLSGYSVVAAATTMCEQVLTGVDTGLTNAKFIDIGKNICEGLAQGIRDYMHLAVEAAEDLAEAVSDAAESEWEINSPSKLFAAFGRYLDEGVAVGINDNSGIPIDAVNSMADTAVGAMRSSLNRLSSLLSNEIDFNPTITPLLDTSKLRRSLSEVNGLFENQTLDGDAKIQNGSGSGSGNSYQFIQNNYSPKALSRVDIYRQTNNQFTRMKGLVEAG